MASPLSALSNILSSGLATIESTYAKHGATFPSLDEPLDSVAFEDDTKLMETIDHVIAAASQVIALVKPARRTILEGAFSVFLPVSLGVAVEANIPEILREAGSQGLHVKDIGKKCGSDSHKMGRVLRYLATNHIFREVSPDVFANNRISSVLDTGKFLSTIKADPINKHDNTSGLPACVGFLTDDMLKAAAYLMDDLLDPCAAASQDPLDCAFSRAFGRESAFDYLEKPENAYRLRRATAAMHGTSMVFAIDIVITGFDWKSLPQDALVVDVGGGVGSLTLQLIRAYPHLRYVVQDRPKIIPAGVKFWEHEDAEALKSGRVELKVHDFFEPQPIIDASIFFLRFVIHDWPDSHAKNILRRLRAAAQPSAKLIICDFVVPYAASSNEDFADIPGAGVAPVPYPLLPNLGTVSNRAVMADLQMMAVANAQERTIGQFIDLVKGTGWQLGSINRNHESAVALLVFNPIKVQRRCTCPHPDIDQAAQMQ